MTMWHLILISGAGKMSHAFFSEALWILIFWHADTEGIDITADIKLLGCTLIPAGEMIARQKLGLRCCHKQVRPLPEPLLRSSFSEVLIKPGKVVLWWFFPPAWCSDLLGTTFLCIDVIKFLSIGTSTKWVSKHHSWSRLQLSAVYYQSWTFRNTSVLECNVKTNDVLSLHFVRPKSVLLQ